ncbi:unnamed protein product [Gongylonema pulchrum]|uniref:Toxin_TOLIP domain-containing protein n=1 Tax=Gongylonema pulchrum TaxID=637853 RepID=A0A183D0J8_9BILA|nr:unnamed protein product [Gongylonema pulchrum]
MKGCLALVTFLACVTEYVACIKCAECDYLPHTSESGTRICPENCYGEICYIVVNNFYNETLVSGCVTVDDNTRAFFRGKAYCYRKKRNTVCGCTTLDRCNSPQAPFSMFTFITTPIFEECEFLPRYGSFPYLFLTPEFPFIYGSLFKIFRQLSWRSSRYP